MLTYLSRRTGVVAEVAEPKEIEEAGGGSYPSKKAALNRRRVLERMDESPNWVRLDTPAEIAKARGEKPSAPRPQEPTNGVFDPAEHGVHEVNAYLAAADPPERERVLQAEAEGKGRATILNGPHSDSPE